MVMLVVLGVFVFVLLVRRRSRRAKVKVGTGALVDALGLVRPYEGKKWKVTRPWL